MIPKTKLKSEARKLEPTVRIGKSGITESVISEIKKQLAARKIVKIKFLKSFIEQRDRVEIAQELALKTDSEVLHQVGFVLVLYRK